MRNKQPSSILKLDQEGFSGVEVFLGLVIVIILGFAGWYIYHVNHKTIVTNSSSTQTTSATGTAQAQTTKAYLDSSNVYSVQYPAKWTVNEQQPGDTIPAPLLDSQKVQFVPINAPELSTVQSAGEVSSNGVDIYTYKSSNARSILNFWVTGNQQTSIKSLTLNGYSALYQQSISTATPTSGPSYTDDVYAVTHNGVTVLFTFREKQSADSFGTPAFNATDTVPAFTALVKSVKFLN
jgi:hypothetical protein